MNSCFAYSIGNCLKARRAKFACVLVISSATLASGLARAGVLDQWTYRTNGLGGKVSFRSVAYGASRFVAAGWEGSSGTIYSSDDCTNWVWRSSAGSTWSSFTCIRYLAGKFIAVGNSGVVTTSSDGTAWLSTNISGANLRSMAYGNGLFAVVGTMDGAPVVYVSGDGTAWSLAWTGPTNIILNDAAFGNGRFVAVGSDSAAGPPQSVATSEDGRGWVCRAVGYNGLGQITFGRGQFIANAGGTKMLASADGESWSANALPPRMQGISGVAFGNGTFVGVGTENQGQGVVAYSTDGANWRGGAIGPWAPNRFLYGGVYGGGVFTAVGSLGAVLQTGSLAVPCFEAIQPTADGQVALDLSGEIGRSYHIDVSSDLRSWGYLLSYTNDDAVTRVLDPQPTEGPRFYRSVSP